MPLALEEEPQAFEEERRKLPQQLVLRARQPAVQRRGVGARGGQVESPFLVEEDPHDAEGRAPQRVRVPRAGRREAEAEEARERVEPVGERHGAAHVPRGTASSAEAGR